MDQEAFAVADAMALELSEKQVDANEAAKFATYLTQFPDLNRLNRLIRAILANPQVVERSNQTAGYYQAVILAIYDHLVPKKWRPRKMARVLSWAVRLLRYYSAQRDEV